MADKVLSTSTPGVGMFKISLIFFLTQTFLFQLAWTKGSPLECRHVNPIEKVFLYNHISQSTLNQELQERVIEQHIRRVDPSKIYLLSSDVDKIRGELTGIFKKLESNDCEPLFKMQRLVLDKIKERAFFAKTFLGKKYKFESKTEFEFDSKKRPYATTNKEIEDFLKKYIHFQVSNYLASDMKLKEATAQVVKSWDRLVKRTAEVKPDDVIASYLDAFASSMDPHSSFMSNDDNQDFQIQMKLSLEGIGATLSSQDGFTVVESLIAGGAAARDGQLQSQDKIIAVGQGETGTMENVIEWDLRDVVRKIRGPKGTKVRLLVMRKEGHGKTRKQIVIVRDKVKLEDDAAKLSFIEKTEGGIKYKLGVIFLPSFYSEPRRGGRSSAEDLKKLVIEAREKKVDGLALDFSTNPGGGLDEAVRIAGLFFQTGNVVKQSGRPGVPEETKKDEDARAEWTGPLVVLVSRASASASEIVAGTLKDYKRAVIVGGDHTFGKGSVQQVSDMPPQSGELGAVKITVGMFFTPGGNSTQHRGVESDIVFPSPFSYDEAGEKNLDFSLPPKSIAPFISPEANQNKGDFAWTPVTPDWIKTLADKSKVRVAASAEFKKIESELAEAKKRGKVIKVGEASKDKEKKEKAKKNKTLTPTEREAEYVKRAEVQEAAQILVDLIGLHQSKKMAQH
jgi:carboxyl-terminal processing protease